MHGPQASLVCFSCARPISLSDQYTTSWTRNKQLGRMESGRQARVSESTAGGKARCCSANRKSTEKRGRLAVRAVQRRVAQTGCVYDTICMCVCVSPPPPPPRPSSYDDRSTHSAHGNLARSRNFVGGGKEGIFRQGQKGEREKQYSEQGLEIRGKARVQRAENLSSFKSSYTGRRYPKEILHPVTYTQRP